MTQLPAVSLCRCSRLPNGTHHRTGQEIERRAPGIRPSLGDSFAGCAIALNTTDVMIGTSITPIYTRNATDFAQTAAFLHRVEAAVGYASHAARPERMGITAGKPLSDMRQFVEDMQAVPRVGDPPPIILATLRDKRICWPKRLWRHGTANGARSHMACSRQPQRRPHETTSLSAT